MKWLMYLLVAILGIFFAIMGLFNSGNVTFDYVLNQQSLPLIVVMLISFVFGALLALIFFGFRALYWRGRAKNAEKELDRIYKAEQNAEKQRDFEALRNPQ